MTSTGPHRDKDDNLSQEKTLTTPSAKMNDKLDKLLKLASVGSKSKSSSDEESDSETSESDVDPTYDPDYDLKQSEISPLYHVRKKKIITEIPQSPSPTQVLSSTELSSTSAGGSPKLVKSKK